LDLHTRSITINGLTIDHADVGRGDTLVFVHGAISDHRIWQPQLEALSASFRCIAPTQRYFGPAPWPERPPRAWREVHVADLIALLECLGPDPVHLVGSSYGGEVVLAAAARRPDRVLSILVNEPTVTSIVTNAGDLAVLQREREDAAAAVRALQAGDATQATRLFAEWTARLPGCFGDVPAHLQTIFLDNARTLGPQLAADPLNLGAAQLAALTCPVTVTQGSLTRPFFQVIAQVLLRTVRSARLVVIPDARHGAGFENIPAFNAALAEHFRRSSPSRRTDGA
jgi:pimeloyl-ACP methyl ester carboxylesterase